MDDQTAKISAQEIAREDPKVEVSPNVEEKISDETSGTNGVRTSDHLKRKSENQDGSQLPDVEIAPDESTPPPIKVPRSRRRGLFGRFTLLAEVEEPKHYARSTKWFITFNIALAALAAPLGSAIIFRN